MPVRCPFARGKVAIEFARARGPHLVIPLATSTNGEQHAQDLRLAATPSPRLLLALVVMSSVLLGQSCTRAPGLQPPKATAGVIDLRTWRFEDGPVALDGDWHFYWQKLLDPAPRLAATRTPERPAGAEVLRPEDKLLVTKVPGSWNNITTGTQRVGPTGYATYRLRVLLPENAGRLALYETGIYTASETFVNGHRLVGSGIVGQNPRKSVAGPRSGLAGLPDPGPSGSLDLLIHVSNFHYRAGGLRKPILLGSEQQLQRQQNTVLAYALLVAGALLIMGLYHILLYGIRSRDLSPLFFGIHCLGVAGRSLTSSEAFLFRWFPSPGYHFYLSFEYCTIPVLMLTFILFLRELFPAEFSKRFTRLAMAAALVLFALPFFLSTIDLSRAVVAYQSYVFLGGFYAMVMTIVAYRRKREGSALLMIGGIILYLGTVNDVLHVRGIIKTGQYGSLTLLAFVCVQAALISLRYAKSFHIVENLSGELAQKNEELTRLHLLKDEFLANSSHELRTPLNGIIGISESLLQGARGGLSPAVFEDLALIASSGRRLTNLVNDILDFSKLQHGDIQLRLAPVDLAPIIRMVLALSRSSLSDKPVTLGSDVPAALPPALADDERIEQVLHNLVGNAVKFTKKGSITVGARVVSGRQQAATSEEPSNEAQHHGDSIELWVADTGIGIPEEKQSLIFESFTQADGSVAREYGGTGLGLSVSRKLVELHGGTLAVESRAGHGARFSFVLPIADGPVLPSKMETIRRTWLSEDPYPASIVADASAPLPEAVEVGQGKIDSIRVLIVDDDPVNLRVLKNHLSLHDYAVTEALNGREALSLIEADEPFDVVLLDVMMPGLSGYEVCRILRGTHSAAELPVIMLTAKNRITDLVVGLESGANDYLAKPFDSRELLARTRTMVELRRAALSRIALATLRGELEVARSIQRALIPESPPEVPGLSVASRYRSMEQVGGDYSDFLVPSPSELGIFVGDVSGHGMPAALIVSLLKTAFYFQRETASSPSLLMNSINQILRANIQRDFVTASYAYINVPERRMVVANAGHPPTLVWRRAESRFIALRPLGRPLGLFDEVEFLEETIVLEAGDRVLLYTDGILEAGSATFDLYGADRFEAAVRELEHLSADDFADEVIRRITEWCGGADRISDDIALVIVDI